MLRWVTTAMLAVLVVLPLRAQTVPDTAQVMLSPGDVMRVEIWKERDLSGDFQVDSRGRVTLPLLGERQVSGIGLDQLREQLLAEYRQSLRNPSINITPLRRVTVLGEVNKPGTYMVDPTVTLAGAIASAGGTNPNGDLGRIRIVRTGAVVQRRLAPEASLTGGDVRSGDEIFVEKKPWLQRNGAIFVSGVVSAGLSIITALILR